MHYFVHHFNETYKTNGTGIKPLSCIIYNRWGQKLYEWNGIDGFWDGKIKTGIAPTGTYYYIINYSGVDETSKTDKGF